MRTDVVMPQMGESIAEGTVSRWLKQVGETVGRDEPLLEISTDKVDAEIPSPIAGTLVEIRVKAGDMAEVHSVVAVIETDASAAATPTPATGVVPSEPLKGESSGLRTDVFMPQMGESIAEGTVARWLKQVGDTVGRDEPLLEISTDKVDAEIPSPVAGTLVEIRVQQGEMAEVNSVIAVIESAGVAGAARPAAAAAPAAAKAPAPSPAPAAHAPVPSTFRGKASPTARVMARLNGLDLAKVAASGSRVTKADVQRALGGGSKPAVSTSLAVGPGDTVEPMSVMRKKIAQHMVESRQTSAHAYSVFLVDCGTVEEWRKSRKAQYDARGVKVSILPFVAAAAVRALKDFPLLNASLIGDQVIYRGHINMGVAVALDSGLIVPVLKDADKLTVVEIARAIADLAGRARNKQLKPEEVTGGTFTVTNPGNFGGSFATPIINQPQVAILELGTVEKRPAVVNDAIAVRPMMNLTLGFDHRLIDGALADQYLAAVKTSLETWNEE